MLELPKIGGSYTLDPATGKLILTEQTQPADAIDQPITTEVTNGQANKKASNPAKN